jgi:3-(3-hydroxy-phenyl)propionate hydroxylase
MVELSYDADVAIIGYGPSGVAAANALGARGVSTVAFEREHDIYARARAVTVSDWTMRCLQSVDLDAAALEDMDETVALRWVTYDGHELLHLPFPPGQLGYATSYAIYQPLLEQTLRDGAERFGTGTVRYGVDVIGVEQDEDGVTVTTKDLATGEVVTTRAKYALACDGGSSSTRRELGVEMHGDTIPVKWIVIDAKVKRWWPNRHILTFWSDNQRPVVDIALGRGNHRWEIPLGPDESESAFASNDDVYPLLEELGVSRDDIDIHQFAFYSHHIRMADRWRVGRVFLVGDAGHLMPPWAGAGMQSGIRDAFNISWKLVEVLAGHLPEATLDTYQAERQPNVAFFTEVAVGLGKIIKQELTPEEMAAMAPKPGELPPLLWPPFYVGGWLRGVPSPDSAVGKMIPQPLAADTRGVIKPLDDLLGNGFVLLGDNVNPASLLSADDRAGWDAVGARYLAVRSADQRTETDDELVDIDGSLLEWMRRFGVGTIAVRPDKFVAASDAAGLGLPDPVGIPSLPPPA